MTIKQTIDQQFEFKVSPLSERTDGLMSKDMRHYSIQIKNKRTGKRASFQYSEGYGINSKMDQKGYSLLSSIYADRSYTSMEDMDDLGYKPSEAAKIFRSLEKQHEKCRALGIYEFFDSLSEAEQEKISDGL